MSSSLPSTLTGPASLPAAWRQKDFYPFIDTDQVRFADLDVLGHVNNLAVGIYFEDIRVKLYHHLFPGWSERKFLFVLAQLHIDYLQELHYPAQLEIGIRLLGFGNSSMRMVSAVFHQQQAVAVSQSVSVYIAADSRKPAPIPAEIREKIAARAGTMPTPTV